MISIARPLVCSLLLIAATCAYGDRLRAEEVAPTPTDLIGIENAMAQSALRQQELEAAALAALHDEAELSKRLITQAQVVSARQVTLVDVEQRLRGLKGKRAQLALDLAAQQDVMSEVLAGLQRLEQNPPPALVVNPHDVLEALRSAMMFGAVVPELRAAAADLQAKLAQLEDLNAQLHRELSNTTQALTDLAAARAEALRLIGEKQAYALNSNKNLVAERKRANELAEKATSLKQLLAELAEQRAKQAAARSKAETEAEQARLLAEQKERERLAAPPIAFSLAKGQLEWPAQGQLLMTFGADSGFGSKLDGIVIATGPGSQVISPVNGKVEFAGKFRSYGQMLILDPGEGYLVLLSGLDQIMASVGQSIRAGEPVGVMGDKAAAASLFKTTPSTMALTNGLPQPNPPVLYVEFRRNGDPVDPAPWWLDARKEAMR